MIRLLRGAIPTPRHLLSAAFPHAIVGVTPPQFLWKPNQLSMWGNATFGDCVTAEEAFAKACNSPEIFLPDRKIITWARNNGVLNGAGIWEVLNLMKTKGIDHDYVRYMDGAFLAVNWQNSPLLRNAIAQGPVKIGVQADELINVTNIGVSNGWIATGLMGGNPEDHCTSLCGYGSFEWLAAQLGVAVPADIDGATAGYAMFTWSTIGIIDEPSLAAICGEAWLRSPTTLETKG